jgi:hypothetical protein
MEGVTMVLVERNAGEKMNPGEGDCEAYTLEEAPCPRVNPCHTCMD